jgi:hypothetical protein
MPGLARAYSVLGSLHWTNCRARDAGVAFREALSHALAAGDPLLAEGAREMLVTLNSHGPTPRAEAVAEVERVRSEARGLIVESSRTARSGRLAAMRGDFDEARLLVERGRTPAPGGRLDHLVPGDVAGAGAGRGARRELRRRAPDPA